MHAAKYIQQKQSIEHEGEGKKKTFHTGLLLIFIQDFLFLTTREQKVDSRLKVLNLFSTSDGSYSQNIAYDHPLI